MSYEYRHVEVIRVLDGDTIELAIDVGNSIKWTSKFRLHGIDTPERGQVNYREAIEFLKTLLSEGISKIETHKPDKYGRWLVDIWIPADDSGDYHVNTMMVSRGLAKPYFGGTK